MQADLQSSINFSLCTMKGWLSSVCAVKVSIQDSVLATFDTTVSAVVAWNRSRMVSAHWRQGTQENQSQCLVWLQSALCFFKLVWKELPKVTAEHIISRHWLIRGSCICLWKQDLSTEIRQLKDQLISISIERQKLSCSTPQGRTEVRPQRVVTEQPSHLVSFHLFPNHPSTQRAIQMHSQHWALENIWMRANALVCLFPFHLPGTRNPSMWAPSQPQCPQVWQSPQRVLLSQAKRGFSASSGILRGQGNQICNLPCSFLQVLCSLLSLSSWRGGWQLDSWKHSL